jgi:hypothetical protein
LFWPRSPYGPPSARSDDGNGDGRGAIGVTAGPGGDIGRGASEGAERGGSFDFAVRLAFGFAALVWTLALRADLPAAPRFAFTALRLRAGAARFVLRALLLDFVGLLALRRFAILASR